MFVKNSFVYAFPYLVLLSRRHYDATLRLPLVACAQLVDYWTLLSVISLQLPSLLHSLTRTLHRTEEREGEYTSVTGSEGTVLEITSTSFMYTRQLGQSENKKRGILKSESFDTRPSCCSLIDYYRGEDVKTLFLRFVEKRQY